MSNTTDEASKAKRPKIIIRQLELDDLAPVFHLGEQIFTASKVPNLYRTWDEFELIELFYADTEFCLVAEHDKKIIGFALGTTIEKERSAWKYGHLVWLGVEPHFQRKGVAERLFHQFRERMESEGVRILMVDTEADNLAALHFFRTMGFGKPEEHIYLSLNLSTQKRPNGEEARPSKK